MPAANTGLIPLRILVMGRSKSKSPELEAAAAGAEEDMAGAMKDPKISDALYGPGDKVPKILEKEAQRKMDIEGKIKTHRSQLEKFDEIKKKKARPRPAEMEHAQVAS